MATVAGFTQPQQKVFRLAQRGIGLYNIRRILKEYENVFLDTEYGDGFFTQTLQVCESKDDREEMEK